MSERRITRHGGRDDQQRAEQANPGEQEPEPRTPPAVWIGSLADYNNGRLTGDWVEAAIEGDELLAAAQRIVAGSETLGAEEWAIFDHEGFGDWHPGETESLEVVARVARGITRHGPAFAAWAELHDGDQDMLDGFEDAYCGEYDNPAAWAEQVMEDMGIPELLDTAIPECLRPFVRVDGEQWAREAWLAGEIALCQTDEGRVWVFRVE